MSKHQIQHGTGRPNPSREAKFSGANGDVEITIFRVKLTTSRTGNLTLLIYTLLHAMTPSFGTLLRVITQGVEAYLIT